MADNNSTAGFADIGDSRCRTVLTMNVRNIALYMLGFFFAIFLCNGLHTLLRPFSQPRVMSEFLVGLFLANIPPIRGEMDTSDVHKTLNYIADFGMICHMFVLGLEIDHHIIVRPSVQEAKVASIGMPSTFILALVATPFLHLTDGTTPNSTSPASSSSPAPPPPSSPASLPT
ncbi:hypothetical protein U1Q18_014352 [Sarracenia purpurea var. burkii]